MYMLTPKMVIPLSPERLNKYVNCMHTHIYENLPLTVDSNMGFHVTATPWSCFSLTCYFPDTVMCSMSLLLQPFISTV